MKRKSSLFIEFVSGIDMNLRLASSRTTRNQEERKYWEKKSKLHYITQEYSIYLICGFYNFGTANFFFFA
ncbi:hypothetical protein DLM75_13665 [Leptospira stimsonii]|uniref:Uncharacterized protein n=1 Tax=Leptospira stimsonii TaxID=2202203 RepID=A0A396Z8I4_9LEPT|nr:hypothetical protein DLM75_13665 [Leptospira stimsonii]